MRVYSCSSIGESSVAPALFVTETAFSPISTSGILLRVQVTVAVCVCVWVWFSALLIYISLCHCHADFITIYYHYYLLLGYNFKSGAIILPTVFFFFKKNCFLFLFSVFFYYFMNMVFFVYMNVCALHVSCCMLKPENSIRSAGTEVTDGCEWPCRCWE